jgi:hypothetical protein
VGQSNRVLAVLLAHLAEVEARGLHRVRACVSLHSYCIYELRMSEDTAFRRVAAARLVRRFPLLFSAVERGEIHLTGLLLLGPHLTEANVVEVMALAKHRTKREILGLVRRLDPLPDVPNRIEVLGPAPRAALPMKPSWSEFVSAMCPVRALSPGERPGDWLCADGPAMWTSESQSESQSGSGSGSESQSESESHSGSESDAAEPALARRDWAEPPETSTASANVGRQRSAVAGDTSSWDGLREVRPHSEPRGTQRDGEPDAARTPSLAGPQRYKVQFTASEEYVQLVEEARALLSHALPSRDLAEVHLRAMRTLVTELKKRKYAVLNARDCDEAISEESKAKPPSIEARSWAVDQRNADRRSVNRSNLEQARLGSGAPVTGAPAAEAPVTGAFLCQTSSAEATLTEVSVTEAPASEPPLDCAYPAEHLRRRGRHIPAAVRHAVFARDEGRCSYVDALGARCRETARLEFHHETPFARGGAHDAANVKLRCTQHNTLAAEQDFGREFIAQRQSSERHSRSYDEP